MPSSRDGRRRGPESLAGRLEFILEADRLKGVERSVKPLGVDRFENSAEHSWQTALLALALADLANEPVDTAKVVTMLLLHDLPEIDTGDTIVYALDDHRGATVAEREAMVRILGGLPAGVAGEFRSLWEEFEAEESAEARYARAIDRAMPMLLNLNNDGQSWKDHGIRKEQIYHKNGKIAAGCAPLWEYLQEQVELMFPPDGGPLVD
ncbi:MAG: HD domain-containing protein [bacterium]|nr:HD domain-containing protein [bacterium]